MNSKGIINITLIISVIVIIAGVAGYFVLRKSFAQPVVPVIEQPLTTNEIPPSTFSGNTFSVNLNGYIETCMGVSVVYKRTDDSWEKVSTELPGKGLYYLDDKFVGYGMCDVVVCAELPKPYTIQLVEYKKIGEKVPPSDSGSTANTLPVYKSILLSGDIKIDINYFGDKNCQSKQTFSTVLKR